MLGLLYTITTSFAIAAIDLADSAAFRLEMRAAFFDHRHLDSGHS